MYSIASVDDDRLNLMVLGSHLELASDSLDIDMEINSYRDGQQFLDSLVDKKPDLIFLDRMMPDPSGDEICRRLKSNEKYRQIPLIFVSAMAMQQQIDSGYQAGCDYYLTKPFSHEDLVELLKKYLKPAND